MKINDLVRGGFAAALFLGLALAPAELFPLLTELELAGRITAGADGYALAQR